MILSSFFISAISLGELKDTVFISSSISQRSCQKSFDLVFKVQNTFLQKAFALSSRVYLSPFFLYRIQFWLFPNQVYLSCKRTDYWMRALFVLVKELKVKKHRFLSILIPFSFSISTMILSKLFKSTGISLVEKRYF